ncbi:CC142 protein, partial [Polypterus senegalus]
MEENKRLQKRTLNLKTEIIPVDEILQKENANVADPGAQNTLTKSIQKAEALLRTHLNPGLKWWLKQRSDGSSSDVDDSFISEDKFNSHSSEKFQRLEQCVLGMKMHFSIIHYPNTQFLHGHIKKIPNSSQSCEFFYHPAYGTLGKHYGKLQTLLEQRSQLLFFHEYTRRLKGVLDFNTHLSKLIIKLDKQFRMLSENLNAAQLFPEYNLSSLCKELRVHTSHWGCLYEKATHTNWLRPILFQKQHNLEDMKISLNMLGLHSLILMEKYIKIIFNVLALTTPESLTAETIFDTFKAVKIFNNIVSEINLETRYFDPQKSYICKGNLEFNPLPHKSKMVQYSSESVPVNTFAVAKILRILSKQRGRMAAMILYCWMINQNKFLSCIDRVKFNSMDWNDVKVPFFKRMSKTGGQAIRSGLLRPKLGESLHGTNISSDKHPFKKFLKGDKEFMDKILKALSSTGALGYLALNRPKPDKPVATDSDNLSMESDIDFSRIQSSGCQNFQSSAETNIFYSQYRVLFWKDFEAALLRLLYQPKFSSYLGSLNQCGEQMVFLFLNELHFECCKGGISMEFDDIMKNICLHLLSKVAFRNWDQVLCRTLGTGFLDKCLPTPVSKEQTSARTKTAEILQQLFFPLHVMLNCNDLEAKGNEGEAPFEKGTPAIPFLRLAVLSRCTATIHYASIWVITKAFQFLSSWSLNQFLLVTQGDLKILKKEAERLLPLIESFKPKEDYVSPPCDILIIHQEQALASQVVEGTAYIRSFSETVLRVFSVDCKKMAVEIFQQTMPLGKHWRINCKTELPNSPSDYASSAAQTVIGQVLEGIQPLPDEAQVPPLIEAMTAFMEAWMDHILKKKIKFSVQGALQLKKDFDMIRDLLILEEYNLSEEIRQRLLSLRVFHQVDNAILCLLQQPMNKNYIPSSTWEPLWRCCTSNNQTADFSSGSLNSLESLDLQAARNNVITQTENVLASDLLGNMRTNGNPESYLEAKQQEWLALRVHSGNRWKIPRLSCMNRTPEN